MKDAYLTKERLIQLYTRSGNILHRGSYRQVFEKSQDPYDMSEIPIWAQELQTLLTQHQISLSDPDYMLIVQMATRNTGHVNAVLMQKVGPAKN